MPEHKVKLNVPNPLDMVGNGDVVFNITADDKRVGTLRVSRGAVDFTRLGKRYLVDWDTFAKLMKGHGRLVAQEPIKPRTKRLRD